MIATVTTWHCLQCEERGADPKADLAARKHLEATGHATVTSTRPKGEK